MTKYLKQKWSGYIYPWSERLAQRDDMEPYEPPQKPAPVQAPEPKTPTQNPRSRPPLPPLDDAIETFKREAKQPPRKKDEA
jgi:hypothetical protein